MLRFLLVTVCLAAQTVHADEEKPFLFYKFQGGYSPYKEITVTIKASGETRVTAQKHKQPRVDYTTELSPEEFAALRTLLIATDFFAQPDKEAQFATDAGQSELSVTEEKRSRKLLFRHRPSLDPLCQFFWRLQAQAEAFQSLSDGNLYSVVGAIVPSDSRTKALQSDRFKAPLKNYLETAQDRRQIRLALQALSWITRPEEFAGFVSLRTINSDNRELFFLDLTSDIPKSHLEALCPLYLAFLKEKSYTEVTEPSNPGNAFTLSIARFLGEIHYQPALPIFLQWFEINTKPLIQTPLAPLAAMGTPSLHALIPKLEDPNEIYRLNAIGLLTIAARTNPGSGYSNPVSRSEYEKMKTVFKDRVLPKLSAMSQSDVSEKVRSQAAEAMKEIATEITKNFAIAN